MKVGQDRVKKMLTDTVSLLCKNSLQYEGEISIEGLLGIKVDKKDVFFVHISENFGKDGLQAQVQPDQIVISDGGPPAKKKRRKTGAAAKKQAQAQAQAQAQQAQAQQAQTVQLELVPKVLDEVKVENQVGVPGTSTECTVLTTHDVKIETVQQQVAEIVAGQRRMAIRTAKDLQGQVQEVTLHPAETTATQAVYEAAAAGQTTFVQPQTYDPAQQDTEVRVPASSCTPTSDPWPTIAATVACVDTIAVQATTFQGTTAQMTQGGDTLQTWSLPAGVVVQTEADTITTLSQPTVQTTTLTTDGSGQQQFTLPKYKWTMLGHRSPDTVPAGTTTVRLPAGTEQQTAIVQQVPVGTAGTTTVTIPAQQVVQQAQVQQTEVQQTPQPTMVQTTLQTTGTTQQQQHTATTTTTATTLPTSTATTTATTGASTTTTQQQQPFTKNRECTICGKTFLLDSSLKRHLRAHAGKKPYKCELCEAAFIQSSDLKKHFRSHTGEKPYSCNICGMAFSQVGDRNRHQARHNRLGKA